MFFLLLNFQGHKLHAFDVAPAACSEAQKNGCIICGSVEEVAEKSNFLITMLPNNDIVYDTYLKMTKNGVKSGTIFVDSSTIDPSLAKMVSCAPYEKVIYLRDSNESKLKLNIRNEGTEIGKIKRRNIC